MGADDSYLDTPLLVENGALSRNRNRGGGGVTFQGESVDVRDFVPAGDVNHEKNYNTGECHDSDPRQLMPDASPDPRSLSLDDNQSSVSPSSSALEYAKRTGRSFYHQTRCGVANFISSRKWKSSSSGVLTVDSTSSSSASHDSSSAGDIENNNDTTISHNNNKRNGRDRITQKSSLFRAPSTPLLLRYLIPPLLIANHALFYHAQTKPMWNLAYKADVAINATASTLKSKAAADALNVPHHYEFVRKESKVVETFTYMDAIRKLWRGEKLGDAQTISKVAAALLFIFSGIWPHLKLALVNLAWFFPFVHTLWLNDGDDDTEEDEGKCRRCVGNKRRKSRCGLCCSDGHSHGTRTVRSPLLRTLSTLGKWSLADVLVVCILIAVLHLDWVVHPDEIRSGIEGELPTLLDYAHSKYPDEVADCTQLLGYTCGKHARFLHYPACLACQTLIKNGYHHPEWTTNEGKDILEGVSLEGGGYAKLRVMGMEGTYYFCGAVIASILLSVLVDWMDERDRDRVEEDLTERRRELEFVPIPPGEGEDGGDSGNELVEMREGSASPPLNEVFVSDDNLFFSQNQTRSWEQRESAASNAGLAYAGLPSDTSTRTPIPSPTTNCHLLKKALLLLLSVSSLPLVCYAVTLPTMQRLVYGGGPALLHEVLGMIWERDYSLIELVKTTGDAGGWDTFLMLTFGLFAIVGPIVRSACLILHLLLGPAVAWLGDCVAGRQQRTALRMVLYRATSSLRKALLSVIDTLGAFCCWEVLLVALVMIQLEMPSITDTIYQDDRCKEADPEHGRTCIEVRFDAKNDILVVVIAWIVLTVASGLAMDLAREESDRESSSSSLLDDAGKEEKRYEFGRPIPRRRSMPNRDRAWMGSSGKGTEGGKSQAGDEVGNEDGDNREEYFSPLQQQEEGGGENNGLVQIVFV